MDRNEVDVENQKAKARGSVERHSKSGTTAGVCSPKDKGNWSRIKRICYPPGSSLSMWNKIFVISCVCAVSLDPLFFYILIIDQDNKCLQMDQTLRTVVILLRLLTDIIFVVHFICEIWDLKTHSDKKKSETMTKPTATITATATNTTESSNSMYNVASNTLKRKGSLILQAGGNSGRKSKPAHKMSWLLSETKKKMSWLSVSMIVEIFAILPIPQMCIVFPFYKMKGSGYMAHKKILNVILVSQYVPRIFIIYLSSKELKRTSGIWVKGLFNFFLYILASHVLGAFWYFFSIQREVSCWHRACVKHSTDPTRCMNNFYCDRQPVTPRNVTFLNLHCPIDSTPDGASAQFSYGIFFDALKNATHIKFGKKFLYSFWWGLRNLSNFGTNLTTSTYVWENLFAILISIIGLLLFLYLIGNVQTFMQMKATESEEIRRNIQMKKLDVREWIAENEFPDDMKKEIMNIIGQILKENKDADLQNPFSVLPPKLKRKLKSHLFMNTVKTVPMLKNMKQMVLEKMCGHMKRVTYNENKFLFRIGDPLDRMLFITDGTIWTYSHGSSSDHGSEAGKSAGTNSPSKATCSCGPLGKGEFYGEELLNWASPTFKELPLSSHHVKSQTKVEAFVLMAKDLATVVSSCRLHWNIGKRDNSKAVKEDMAQSTIATNYRRHLTNKNQRQRPHPRLPQPSREK